jgi:hypothetical protein
LWFGLRGDAPARPTRLPVPEGANPEVESMRDISLVTIACLLAAAVAGCADPAAVPHDDLDRLSGTVTSTYDDLASDGGAGLWLRDDADGQVMHAYLPSLFTSPPPSEATLAAVDRVMPVLRRLRPGDRVIAAGHLDDGGLRMELLTAR